MFQKLVAQENAWIKADNVERLKVMATTLIFGGALLAGVVGVVVGLL